MYAKVYLSMWDGSLGESWQAWAVFVFLLAACDRQGFVYMTPERISKRTSLPLEAVAEGLRVLMAPDPTSRLKDHEGRRLVEVDTAAWRIVNYAHYREMFDAESRREVWRRSKARARNEQASLFPESSKTVPGTEVDFPPSPTRERQRQREKQEPTSTSLRSVEDALSPADGVMAAPPWSTEGAKDGPSRLERGTGSGIVQGCGVRLPCAGLAEVEPTLAEVAEWKGLFPAVDVLQALRSMRAWLDANPKRQKTKRGVKAFVVNWLNREQNSGRTGRGDPPSGPRAGADRRYLDANGIEGGKL